MRLSWLAFLAVAFCFGWLKQSNQVDDASIYLRYARNVIEGRGWAYNAGESVNGASSTGNTLLLIALSWLTGGRYYLAQLVLFALGVGAAAHCAWRLFRPEGLVPAMAAGAVVLSLPLLYWLVGMDSALILGFAAGAVAAYEAGRFRTCAFLLAWLVLVRADGLLLAGLLLLRFLWAKRHGLRHEVETLAAAAAMILLPIAAWAVFSLAEFGTVLPKTLPAKLAQSESGLAGPRPIFLRCALDTYDKFCSVRGGVFLSVYGHPLNAIALVFVALGCIGVLVALARRHASWPLIVFGLGQFAVYCWLDLPDYGWYYLPGHMALGLGVAVLVSSAWRLAWVGRGVALVLVAAWLWVHAPDPRRGHLHYIGETRMPHWFECAAWLREHVGPTGSLGTAEVGILGFELPLWRIVDMWGLVTPGGVEEVARGDFTWWFRAEKPDWIVLCATWHMGNTSVRAHG